MTNFLPTPVLQVLSTLQAHGVQALLMGGQACIVYGASEFSRDVDVTVLATDANMARLRAALNTLGAQVIAVPPFDVSLLERGHAVHFRCEAAGGIRLDIMTRMRGVPEFSQCWTRRTVLTLDGVGDVDVLGLEDLVLAKKTRRDKDWPVIRRLVDSHYRLHADTPTEARVDFWLRELRTPDTLLDVVERSPDRAVVMATRRAATACALGVRAGTVPLSALIDALRAEEAQEREADDAWWRPLQLELEQMRRAARDRA